MKLCPKCQTKHELRGIFCSRKCANSRNWNAEDRLKKSIASKNSEKAKAARLAQRNRPIPPGWKIKIQRPIQICIKCNKEIVSVRYKKDRKYHAECWRSCSGGLQPNSTIKHRSIYKSAQMDSGSELQFAKLLDKQKIKWIKNKDIFFLYVGVNGKERKYYPDFFLPEYDLWIEIKGKFYADLDENLQLKLQSVPNIRIVYSNEIKHFNVI
mgnify:CR=1 FL=1